MVLVLRLEGDQAEVGPRHRFQVRGVDEDGKQFLKIEGTFTFPPQVDPAIAPSTGNIIKMENIVFEKAGVYAFEVYANNRYLDSIPISVIVYKN